MTIYAPARDIDGRLSVGNSWSASYGHAEARRNLLNAAYDTTEWIVAARYTEPGEWLPAGCVQYTGYNTECGDDPELIVSDMPYCRKHGEALQALEREVAKAEADPEYQRLAANGWAEE